MNFGNSWNKWKKNLAKYNWPLPFIAILEPKISKCFRFFVRYPKRMLWKGLQRESDGALLSLWKKGKGRAGHGQITSTSLSAPASAPGELGMHRRNQKTWVPVPALPLTTYVTLGKLPDISEFQFHCSMLWGLSMIYINVICSLPTYIQTVFITVGLASSLFLWSLMFWLVPSWSSPDDFTTLLLTVRSLYRNHCSCPLHASQSVKLKWTNLHAGLWDTAIPSHPTLTSL